MEWCRDLAHCGFGVRKIVTPRGRGQLAFRGVLQSYYSIESTHVSLRWVEQHTRNHAILVFSVILLAAEQFQQHLVRC